MTRPLQGFIVVAAATLAVLGGVVVNATPASANSGRAHALRDAGTSLTEQVALSKAGVPVPTPGMRSGEFVLINEATGLCLHHVFDTWVKTSVCNRAERFMLWDVIHLGFGNYRIKNRASGRCLDSNRQLQVYMLDCNFGQFQEWIRYDSTRQWVNRATGYCLDSNFQEQVYTHPCNDGNFQKWFVT